MVTYTIHSAPRDTQALLKLDNKQRQDLYKEIQKNCGSKLEPGIRKFNKLSPEEQSEVLYTHLHTFDVATAGFAVEAVALPTRTKSHTTNQKRLDAFAEEMQDALNGLRDADRNAIQMMPLGDHGVVLIGFKPPPAPRAPTALLLDGLPNIIRAIAGQDSVSPSKAQLGELLSPVIDAVLSKKNLQAHVTRSDVEPIILDKTKSWSAEVVKEILDVAGQELKKHEAGCMDDDCPFSSALTLVLEVLEDRLPTQLN